MLTCVGEKMRPGHPCRAPGPAWPRPHPQRRDTQWPLRTSVSRVLEPLPAALRLLWAASVLPRKERSTWPRPPGAQLPGAQSQSTARGGILGGGAHACSGPAAHRGEGAAVPEAHAPGSQLLPLADLGTGGGHSTADFPFCPMSPPCWGPVPTGVRAAGWGAGRSWQRPGRCESLL